MDNLIQKAKQIQLQLQKCKANEVKANEFIREYKTHLTTQDKAVVEHYLKKQVEKVECRRHVIARKE